MSKEQKQQGQQKEKEQKKPSPFDLAVKHVLERCAWYADRTHDMMPYSEVYKLINGIVNELNAAHMQVVVEMLAMHADVMLQDFEHAAHLIEALEGANATIDILTEHLKAANNTIKFEKHTRLELPRDAHGNHIYPDSMLERWGSIEDFWYSNGHWQVRGHDTSAPWIPAEEAVVCQEDSEDKPEGGSDQATPEPKRPYGCRTRAEAERTVKAFCLGNLSPLELLYLLYHSDDDTSWEA